MSDHRKAPSVRPSRRPVAHRTPRASAGARTRPAPGAADARRPAGAHRPGTGTGTGTGAGATGTRPRPGSAGARTTGPGARRPQERTHRPQPRTSGPPSSPALLPKPGAGRRRIGLIVVVWLVITLAIGWRLVSLQVRSSDDLAQLAAAQSEREIEIPARRGRIYDRDLSPLATSVTASSVYAHPPLLAEAGEGAVTRTAEALAPVLGRSADAIAGQLRQDTTFVYLGRQLDRAVAAEVSELGLPGVGVLEEPRREYPAGDLAAQVVGFAGIDNEGLSGLERVYDEQLSGTPGSVRLERGNNGLTIGAAPEESQPALPGTDMVLTIDRQIQDTVEQTLTAAVEEFDAESGSAVVLDVDTGDLLGVASVPTKDEDGERARLRAVTDVYEPGSVSKVITTAAALEEDLVTPRTSMMVPDRYEVEGRTYSDSHSHETERMSVTEIMADSSNVGTIMLAEKLGAERLHEYLTGFGFGQHTGLGFPGGSAGYVPAVEDWYNSSLPTLAIGQGLSTSTLHIAQVYATIAAGGERIEPRLVGGTVGTGGAFNPAAASPRTRVVSEETAGQIADMLEEVVAEGTGGNAALDGWTVAGKTGTAQKAYTDRRGYEPGAYIGSFAGYAPAEDPEIVVVVSLDEPRPAYYGGTVAAPAFAEIMSAALTDQRVPGTADDVDSPEPPGDA